MSTRIYRSKFNKKTITVNQIAARAVIIVSHLALVEAENPLFNSLRVFLKEKILQR